jgi:hydrogenase maturation protease
LTASALVIGYGNGLRSDDGAGWHVADRLLADARAAGTEVVRGHQLMPEYALDVSRASVVVFVDASNELAPGAVAVRSVAPAAEPSAWSHHLTPAALLALSRELYGTTPSASLVSIGAASFDVGDRLSAVVEDALPVALDAVMAIVGDHADA